MVTKVPSSYSCPQCGCGLDQVTAADGVFLGWVCPGCYQDTYPVLTRFINLTPHQVLLWGDGGATLSLPPSGQVARRLVRRDDDGFIVVDGVPVPVARVTAGDIVGLPNPVPGVTYVVSALVAHAAHRRDVVAPDLQVRDDAGQVVLARGLARHS